MTTGAAERLIPTEEDDVWVVRFGDHRTERIETYADEDGQVSLFGFHGSTPVTWQLTPAQARQLAGSLELAADQADGIYI